MTPAIRLQEVHKRHGALHVLRGVNLEIPAHQTVSIIGRSGSGKSTLLRLLMTLDRPDSGVVEIEGESPWETTRGGRRVAADDPHLRRVRGKVGMVFQHFNLFPHMTALDNVMEAPVRVLGLKPADAERRAREYLGRVGLSDKLDARPAALSGGQKQRVAIARALAMQPRIMLFDEITSALDPELVGGMLALLRELAASRTMTMLIVTHHMRFAERSADRVLFFDEGVIAEDGPPGVIFRNPVQERTRRFVEALAAGED